MKSWTIVKGYRWKAFTVATMSVAALIFGFRDYISPYAGSVDLCSSAPFIDILSGVVPKVGAHCNKIMELELEKYPGLEVSIVMDMWYFLSFCLFLIYTLYKLIQITEEDLKEIMKIEWHGEDPSGRETILRIFGGPFVLLFCMYHVFFEAPLTPEEMTTYHDSSLTSAAGAAFQALIAVSAPYMLFITVVFLRIEIIVRRKLGKGGQEHSGTDFPKWRQ